MAWTHDFSFDIICLYILQSLYPKINPLLLHSFWHLFGILPGLFLDPSFHNLLNIYFQISTLLIIIFFFNKNPPPTVLVFHPRPRALLIFRCTLTLGRCQRANEAELWSIRQWKTLSFNSQLGHGGPCGGWTSKTPTPRQANLNYPMFSFSK